MRATVLPLAGTEPGRAQLTIGAGGDRTMELDRAAEADVFAELEALAGRGERFAVLSEEAGHRKFGADYPLVLVDPVDGSLKPGGASASPSCLRRRGTVSSAPITRWCWWTRWTAASTPSRASPSSA